MTERRIKYWTIHGKPVDVSFEDFSVDQRRERDNAEVEVHVDIHSNTGCSNSWLRRLAHELNKLDLSLSDRTLTNAICDISDEHETWDSLIEAIKELAKGTGNDQSQGTTKEHQH